MSEPDEAEESLVVRCTRCADLAVTTIESVKRKCRVCGRRVWVSTEMISVLAKRYPNKIVSVACIQCGVGERDRRMVNLPEQVGMLRATGDSDAVIAYKFAIADLSGGCGSLEETEAEILAFPDGLKAKAFPAALRKAQLQVAVTRRLDN